MDKSIWSRFGIPVRQLNARVEIIKAHSVMEWALFVSSVGERLKQYTNYSI